MNSFQKAALGLSFLVTACGGGASGNEPQPEPFDIKPVDTVSATYTREQVLEVAITKSVSFAQSYSPENGYPISDNGVSFNYGQSSLRWSSGFYPGILWQLSHYSEDEELLEQAKRWTAPLEQTAEWEGHDIGFLVDYTFGKGYRSALVKGYDEIVNRAADKLLSRFNSDVGAIRSWDSDRDFLVIIDNMMNLSLLFNAAREFNDERYYNAALAHMQTTAREFVRADGGSFHVVHFNQDSGAVVHKRTQQGAADDSTWARGQAWGIYGFALAYKETGDEIALQTAINMANYYLNKLPEDNVPYWDFSVTDPAEPRDTSAASIAAAGLWMLGKQVAGDDGEVYRSASLALTDSLLNENYLVIDESKSVLLKHATGNKPGDFEVDVSLIYADYYLIEAILLQQEIIEWPL